MDLGKNESKRTQTCNRSHCVTAAKMPQKMNKTAKFIMLFAFFLCGLFVQIFVQLFAAFSCHFVSITLWYVCIFLKWFCIDFVSLYGFSFSHFLNELFYVCEFFCASFANRCEFLDSLQPLCNNSFFLSFSLLLFCLFCLFSVHLQSFLIILWYLWSIFM